MVTMTTSTGIPIDIEFAGGAELLFDNQRKLTITLPGEENEKWTIARLIAFLRQHHLKERPELFVQGQSVRPGILVLVNETDWELLGELNYEIKSGDRVMFISTLHGG
jgi:ubiquitin related modifier 1